MLARHRPMAAMQSLAAKPCTGAWKSHESLPHDGFSTTCLGRAAGWNANAGMRALCSSSAIKIAASAARCSASNSGQRCFWRRVTHQGRLHRTSGPTRCLQAESTLTTDKDTVKAGNGAATRNSDSEEGEEEEPATGVWKESSSEEGEDAYGEVNKILGSRVVDRTTQYLIEWKDDHPDSWEPADNVARDVLSEYEQPWWQAARKADDQKLLEILLEEGRDVDAIDENQRTALLFAAGMGSERCVRALVEAGADVHWQDKDGYTALHIASGYVHTSVVRALLELEADPELEDNKGRSSLKLAQDLLNGMPKTNPMLFAKRLALDQVVKLLDESIFETVEVEQILDKRVGERGITEYLVKWSDESEDSWVQAGDVGEDLIKDYEGGLEYGIAEQALDKREVSGKVEYLVKWADSEENTWEPAENVADEIIAEYEALQLKK